MNSTAVPLPTTVKRRRVLFFSLFLFLSLFPFTVTVELRINEHSYPFPVTYRFRSTPFTSYIFASAFDFSTFLFLYCFVLFCFVLYWCAINVYSGAISAGHDRSDGGLASLLLEMAFAGQIGCGLDVDIPSVEGAGVLEVLFSEEV